MASTTESILAYQAQSAIEAHALANYLSAEGIKTRVLGEALQGAYAGIDVGRLNTVEVWVAAADRDAAAPLISQWKAEHQPAAPEAPPRRFQFSLFTALMAVTTVALVAAVDPILAIPTFAFWVAYVVLKTRCRWPRDANQYEDEE